MMDYSTVKKTIDDAVNDFFFLMPDIGGPHPQILICSDSNYFSRVSIFCADIGYYCELGKEPSVKFLHGRFRDGIIVNKSRVTNAYEITRLIHRALGKHFLLSTESISMDKYAEILYPNYTMLKNNEHNIEMVLHDENYPILLAFSFWHEFFPEIVGNKIEGNKIEKRSIEYSHEIHRLALASTTFCLIKAFSGVGKFGVVNETYLSTYFADVLTHVPTMIGLEDEDLSLSCVNRKIRFHIKALLKLLRNKLSQYFYWVSDELFLHKIGRILIELNEDIVFCSKNFMNPRFIRIIRNYRTDSGLNLNHSVSLKTDDQRLREITTCDKTAVEIEKQIVRAALDALYDPWSEMPF